MEPFDKRGKPSRKSVGRALISLANDENAENIELLHRIELAARYFESSSASDRGITEITLSMDTCILNIGPMNLLLSFLAT